MNRFYFYGKTDQGLRRKINEDTILVDEEKGFCLVADGIGGTAAGDVASQMFANTAAGVFVMAYPPEDKGSDLIKQTFQLANESILRYVAKNPNCRGMGCTAELLLFTGRQFVLGHLGDSRTYRLRQGNLKQLTKDHSLVQEQLDQGMITKEEALTHAFKNVILRAVGVKKNFTMDILKGNILPGDLFLLCSDGLTDMIEDAMIKQLLNSGTGLKERTEKLIQEANARGGKDNISVVLAEVHK